MSDGKGENKMTFAAAVVVYNMACSDSPTCQALEALADSDISVLIYDNSTTDYHNRAYCEKKGWAYLGGTGNVGISKAYNACIDYLTSGHETDTLCLFDDDTHLTEDYFQALRQAKESSGGHIFVPMIFAAGNLISPCILKPGHRVIPFEKPEDAFAYTGDELSAINSCMAIDLCLFKDFRYDEHIFLDGVDHHFTRQMRQRGEGLHIIDYRCDHAFSGTEKPPKASALVRFGIYAKDYRYILRNEKKSYLRLVGKRALRLTVQYRSLAFLRAFFKTKS